MGVLGKMGLTEPVSGVRYSIRQGADSIDDLLREGALGLELLGDVVLHCLAKLDEVGEVRLVWDMPSNISL